MEISTKYTVTRAQYVTDCRRCGEKILVNSLCYKGDGIGNTICKTCKIELYDGDIVIMQRDLQKNVMKRDLEKLRGVEKETAIKEMIIAAQGELSEFAEAMKILPWKNKATKDLEMAIEELIDVHHFLNNLYILCGVTSEKEVKFRYEEKLNKNKKRGNIHESASHNH